MKKKRELSPSLKPLKPFLGKTILAPCLKLFEVATELLTPFIVRYIIDEGIAKDDLNFTLLWGGVILLLAFLGFAVTMVAQYLSSRVAADYGAALKLSLFEKISTLSEGQLSRYGKDKALTLVSSDAFNMQSGVNMFMRLIFRPPFLLLGSCILSFVVDYRAGIIFSLVILFSLAIFLLVIAVSPKKYSEIQANLDQISGFSNDTLKGARQIRAFSQEEKESKKFETSLKSYEKRNMGMAFYNALISPVTFFLINLGMILVVWLGNLGESGGNLTTGEIVSLISYLTSSLQAMIMFSRLIVSLNKAMSSKKRIDSFLALEPDIVDGEKENVSVREETPLLSFNDVSFAFEGDERMVVSHLSFSLYKGGTLGIIGPTGSGKSTLISLAMRIYDPKKGNILFMGTPIHSLKLNTLHSFEAYVSQRPAIFKGTIRSNLLLGKENATEEELIQACKDACAWEYISSYVDKLDHEVEEAGANLSGGQKQRLLLARAFLKNATLLILDDSLSALDYLTERKILDKLKEKGCAVILVSSRVGSLRDMDEILYLEAGKIVSRGKHEELLSSCKEYREIYEMQKGVAE